MKNSDTLMKELEEKLALAKSMLKDKEVPEDLKKSLYIVVTATETLIKSIKDLKKHPYEERMVGNDTFNGLTVSTCRTTDMGLETALLDGTGAHPVERYDTKEEAEEGHKRWCEVAPDLEFYTEIGWLEEIDENFKEFRKTPVPQKIVRLTEES